MEVWKEVVGFPLYKVSDQGRLLSVRHNKLIGTVSQIGYPVVTLGGKARYIHRLLAEAFLGKCPVGFVVNHKDGIKTNNLLSNLEYVTQAENNRHAGDTGLFLRGRQRKNTKLTNEQVLTIKAAKPFSGYVPKLASEFGVHVRTIYAIRSGHNWRWLNAT